jgi:hypothetical protein
VESKKNDSVRGAARREGLVLYVIGVEGVMGLHYSDVCDTYGFRDSISSCK